MIKKNILGLLFLLSALCLFNSCEDDPYYDDYGWATDALCNNTWVDFYTNNKGYECEQRLDFYNVILKISLFIFLLYSFLFFVPFGLLV